MRGLKQQTVPLSRQGRPQSEIQGLAGLVPLEAQREGWSHACPSFWGSCQPLVFLGTWWRRSDLCLRPHMASDLQLSLWVPISASC